MLWNILESSNVTFSFCWHRFLWDIFIFLIATTSHICHRIMLAAYTNWNSTMSPCPHSAIFYNSIYAWFKSTSSILDSISLPHFCLCWATLSQLSIFVKCHMDLSLGDKRQDSYMLYCLHELNNRCTVTNYQQPLKEVTWFVTDQDMYLLFMWWFTNWRESSKVSTAYNYSQLKSCGNWNLNCVFQRHYYLMKPC